MSAQVLHLLTPVGAAFGYSLIMCMNPDDLRSRADWDGAEGSSREQLLLQLQGPSICTTLKSRRKC